MELAERLFVLLTLLVEFFKAMTLVDPLCFSLYIVTMSRVGGVFPTASITQTVQTNILNSRHGSVYRPSPLGVPKSPKLNTSN